MSSRSALIAVLTALLSISPALAVDLYNGASTAQAVGMSGIFAGSTSGPTDALTVNPAALSWLSGRVLEVSGVGVFAGGSYRNSSTYPGTLNNSSGLAPSAAFGMRIGQSRWSVGAGLLPASLLSDSWRFADPVGAAGASYGVQTNKSAFVALQSSFGTAFRVSRRLTLGGELGVLYNRNTLHSPYIFQNNALTGLKTLLDLHTSGVGYNGTFGLTYGVATAVEVGASYKTRTFVRTDGNATGNAGVQFAALGLPFQPAFRYSAEVDNIFPQSASAYVAWQVNPRVRAHAQADWANWHRAFVDLPVRLTNGTNSDINSLLGSTSLSDSIPLRWRNQLTVRFGGEYALSEKTSLLAGYSHANNPVPSSTLSPLTANIMQDGLSTGLTYRPGRYLFGLAYQVNLPATQNVGHSILESGEFNNTQTHLWLQSVVLMTGLRW